MVWFTATGLVVSLKVAWTVLLHHQSHDYVQMPRFASSSWLCVALIGKALVLQIFYGNLAKFCIVVLCLTLGLTAVALQFNFAVNSHQIRSSPIRESPAMLHQSKAAFCLRARSVWPL